MSRLNAMNASEVRQARAVVLAQPHRMGRDDPRLASALGRFCLHAVCNQSVLDGVQAYAEDKRKWSIAVGRPAGYEATDLAGCGEGPTAEQVERWRARIVRVHTEVVEKFGSFVMSQVHRLAVEDLDLREDTLERNTPVIRAALGHIATVTGHLQSNPHPFNRAA